MGPRFTSPPPTTAHHLRPGSLLLCESYSHACRIGTLVVVWKFGIDSMQSTLFLCTFADSYISREREKKPSRVRSESYGGRTAKFLGGTADYVSFITYLISKNSYS